MADCSKCGAKGFSWLGGYHKCHAEFKRRVKFENNGWIDVPEPHTVEEYEEHYFAKGRKNHIFQEFD